MSNLIFYRDKKEQLTFDVQVEGVNINDTKARLCLEMENGNNKYFKCTIKNNGECTVNIPPLKDVEYDSVNLIIEVIADTSYFKVFESVVPVKNAVNVKFNNESFKENIKSEEPDKPKVNFSFKSLNHGIINETEIVDNDTYIKNKINIENEINENISKNTNTKHKSIDEILGYSEWKKNNL